jgi:poly-gamma-glutamate capsule biosynthesis protein CapA/YwtB (metallophosphatase superfamily)
VIGNAEVPIAERRQPYFERQRWSYNAEPEAAEAPTEVGFDALDLLNNHAYARGPEGLDDTMRHLEPADVEPFGAGVEGLGPFSDLAGRDRLVDW